MKLKYILPVATVASVATIVTPLVTSCGKGGYDATQKLDTSGGKEIEKKQYTDSEIDVPKKDYLEAILKDKTILEHDFMYNANEACNTIKSLDGEHETEPGKPLKIDLNMKSFKGLIKDVSVRKITVATDDGYLLSMQTGVNINIVADIDGYVDLDGLAIEEMQGKLTAKANLTIKLTDFPIVADVEHYVTEEGKKVIEGDNAVGLYIGDGGEDQDDIPGAYSYNGNASLAYKNHHDQALDLNFKLKGKKAFDYTNGSETQWDTDPFGTITLLFMSSIQSYYLKDVIVGEA